jgi:hypothetical protein
MNKDKKIYTLFFVVSAMTIATMLIHGCSVSPFGQKKLVSISLTPASNIIAAGTVLQFKASGQNSDQTSSELLSSSLAWSTSDASVATISQDGLATAVTSSGTCTITGVQDGVTGTATLIIKNLPLLSIAVTPVGVTVNKGLTQQFTASGLFSDGTDTIPDEDITTLVSWSSTTTSVATIDANSGLLTGVAEGATDIIASKGTVTSDPVTVAVSNVTLQSITITHPNVMKAKTAQFTATGTFVDGTTRDMTSQAVWTSSTPDIATVDSTGLVTGIKPGHATVNATAGGITGTVTFNVYSTCTT